MKIMSNKTIKITIPDELTIEQYNRLGQLEHLSEIEKIIRIVSSISEYQEEEIKTWDLKSLNQIYTDLLDAVENITPIFLPVFQYKGVKYGIQPLSKMTAGEYISLEKKLEEGDILGTIAILYRPLKKDKLDSFKWHAKSYLKYVRGKAENLFKYYELEDYDLETVEWRKDIFQELPISMALGAYTFFLTVGLQLSNSILQSSEEIKTMEMKMMGEQVEKVLENIGVGFSPSTTSRKMGVSSDSQEKEM